jgi:hypothetical protein
MDVTGSKLKLARANRHIRDLENLFETFICESPHRIEVTKNVNVPGVNVSVVFDKTIPIECSTIIGDALHNMRSALDILAAEAVRSNGNTPKYTTGFPIYKNKADLSKCLRKKLEGSTEKFIKFIEGFDTYSDGNHSLIYILSQLNNLDKHERFVPTTTVSILRNISIIHGNNQRIEIGELNIPRGGNGTFGLLQSNSDTIEVKADSDSSISVVFSNTNLIDGEEIISSLNNIHSCVSGIVNSVNI